MRRLELCLLVSGVLAFSACGSDGGSSKDGGAGKGGHGGAGTGGGGSGGTGGVGTGTGGGGGGGTNGGGTGGGGTAGGGTAGGGSGGAAGTAGMDGGVDVAPTDAHPDMASDMASSETGDGPIDGVPLSAAAMRGQYLANSVLGCSGCHTKTFAGNPTFVTTGGNLASANLTPDATGIKNLTDQQVIDAFTKGIFPGATDAGTQYLFANMPYYQFATLTTADAMDIVAYLRSLAPVNQTAANTGAFATRPTAAQWTLNTLAGLPNAAAPDGGVDGGADAAVASTSNGKYLASLVCATCHTVTTGTTVVSLDETKAFQGGRPTSVTVTVPLDGGTDAGDAGDAGDAATTTMVTETIGSANLTPDVTGLAGWTAPQISTAITTAKDKMSRSICGMRASAMTASDATDIANYLQAIPAVANTPAPTCY